MTTAVYSQSSSDTVCLQSDGLQLPRFDGDWDIRRLGDIASFFKGSGLSKSDLTPDGNRRCIHYGQLFTTYGERITKVSSGTNLPGVFFLSRPNDVLMPASDVTPNGLATASCILLADVILGGDVLVIRPAENILNGEFLAYVIKMRRDEILRLVSGTTVFHLYGRDLSDFRFSVPSVAEQAAIAAVLSDVGGLLKSFDALIAKKRAVKQAAMQRLLTGRSRLPGFSGEWKTNSLGDIADIKTGDRNNQDKTEYGQYPFFVRSADVERINTYSFEGEAILVPGEGDIGNIFHYINGRFDVHQRVYSIRHFSGNVSGKFVYYSMVLGFGRHALQNTVKATVDSLRLPTFEGFNIRMPRNVKEQEAVASVLSDMDEEIVALEWQRDKCRDVKQGVMQHLLSGRVRLVKPE